MNTLELKGDDLMTAIHENMAQHYLWTDIAVKSLTREQIVKEHKLIFTRMMHFVTQYELGLRHSALSFLHS